MRGIVLGFGSKDSLLFAGSQAEARAYFKTFKGQAGISEIQLWVRSGGLLKSRKLSQPKKAKK